MKRSIAPRLTRTRRRALTAPFVITLAATGSACGEIATVPAGDRPAEQGDVVSNPAEPEPAPEGEVVISNPAEPEPEANGVDEVVSNPAPPEDDPTTDAPIVVSNPAPPSDG